ncbi:MAG: CpaD family pilus assembly protein [Erythrobacter sp.]|jgi:pilus assembly protein CpaD|uniref:CpaD family pilus assembly protein n=1 Tax=Qipengyuania TaxID=1855416 RepID=UPI000BCA6714|nr:MULTISPECIES: CpaD family pilus assembly protein [Qipengyuania]MBL4718155.1 CpaD family pilus assembly protein [Erythrobacter sp.]PCH79017.1 MAG: pilus assembly protein CpaD [Erythrobacteraceae bacterium]WPL56579.1 CpaD family pilus assembly protein [Qipengyuania sp. HL-TH5]MCP2017207.1 pilus assembly protein CpaD [Qipengyuania citrea]MDE0901306.1 CpaD family pilus assembly protein [Erythrobacter sp.]|tara:strand:- start:149003 stop:149653 length:651 start_codon:yes stop_codon:yes gene_type:complete
MAKAITRKLTGSLAVSLSLVLGACGGFPTENRSLYSARQPVVERTNFTLDVNTVGDGLAVSEQQRVSGWFEAMGLGYGDRVSLDDPTANPALKDDLAALAGRHGLLVTEGSPVTAGYVEPGQARIVVTRSTASVPGCPDWSANNEANEYNATYPGYGCAVNGNLAAMVANPEDLISGQQGTGQTVVTTSTKAIRSYREKAPTGAGDLTEVSTNEGG